MKRFTTAVCLLLFAAAGRADEAAKPVTVPITLLKSRHFTVPVKVNGEGPFALIFDTGAPITLINNKVARAAGLSKDKRNVLRQAKAKTLQVGTLEARDVPVTIMDHPTVSLVSKVLGPVDGIVGFSFFARYKVTIDYQAKQLTFVPTKYQPADLMAKMMSMTLFGSKDGKKVVASAGVWGFQVGKKGGDEAAGVDVTTVVVGGPAAAAGLKAGDRLLTLHGRWTDSVVDTFRAASEVRPGTAARIGIRRDGKEMELTVNVQPGL